MVVELHFTALYVKEYLVQPRKRNTKNRKRHTFERNTVHNMRVSNKLPPDPIDVELKLEHFCLSSTDSEKEEECH